MRCADYLAEYFFQQGVDRVFMVTGGGAMHLNDALVATAVTILLSVITNKPALWPQMHISAYLGVQQLYR